jgi:DNA repair protein RadC
MTKGKKISEMAAAAYGEAKVEGLNARGLLEVALGLSPIEAQMLLSKIETGLEGNVLSVLSGYSSVQLQALGLTPEASVKLRAAVEFGRRVFASAPKMRTVIDDPKVVGAFANELIGWSEKEQFVVVSLNIKHEVIGVESTTTGTCSETLAHPREIFQSAIRLGAARIIVSHNHPSGSLDASTEDILLTRQLLEAARLLGIPILDHVIVCKGNFSSIRETTQLWSQVPQE